MLMSTACLAQPKSVALNDHYVISQIEQSMLVSHQIIEIYSAPFNDTFVDIITSVDVDKAVTYSKSSAEYSVKVTSKLHQWYVFSEVDTYAVESAPITFQYQVARPENEILNLSELYSLEVFGQAYGKDNITYELSLNDYAQLVYDIGAGAGTPASSKSFSQRLSYEMNWKPINIGGGGLVDESYSRTLFDVLTGRDSNSDVYELVSNDINISINNLAGVRLSEPSQQQYYDEGYNDGVIAGQNDKFHSISEVFSSVGRTMQGILNIDIAFGISAGAVIMSILALALLRFFLGLFR